jgi:hypothetical protein
MAGDMKLKAVTNHSLRQTTGPSGTVAHVGMLRGRSSKVDLRPGQQKDDHWCESLRPQMAFSDMLERIALPSRR